MAGQMKTCEGKTTLKKNVSAIDTLVPQKYLQTKYAECSLNSCFLRFAEKLQLKLVILAGSTYKLEEANSRRRLIEVLGEMDFSLWRNKC